MDSVKFKELVEFVVREVNDYTTRSYGGFGLSQREAENFKNRQRDVAYNIRRSCSGDLGARALTEGVVRDIVRQVVTSDNVCKYVTYDSETEDPWVLFEAIMYRINTPLRAEERTIDVEECDTDMRKFFKPYEQTLVMTETHLRNYYRTHDIRLTNAEQISILSHLVYVSVYGLGIIDTLNFMADSIEEVQLGMGGVQSTVYNYRDKIVNATVAEATYAKDRVYVVVNGRPINLEYLRCDTNDELKRIIRNLIKDAGAGELTQQNPRINAETVDGRRITAARPPYQDAWSALVRKASFAVAQSIRGWDSQSTIYNAVELIVRSGANISITGDMETGKTTLLRAFLASTSPSKSIRIIEVGSFELNARKYLPSRNASSYRIVDDKECDDVMAFVRKTTGHIFSVGEVNSLKVANIVCNIAKVVPQVIFTSHHNTTDELITDFKNAKLQSGFTSERLAELEAASVVNINVHIGIVNGVRKIMYIDEVIPEHEAIAFPSTVQQGLENIRHQLDKTAMYHVNRVVTLNAAGEYVKVGTLSSALIDRARYFMDADEYLELKGWNE